MTAYTSLVRCPKMEDHSTIAELGTVQKSCLFFDCMAMKIASNVALKPILDLPPLQRVMVGETRIGNSRLLTPPREIYKNNQIKQYVNTSRIIPRIIFNKNLEIIRDRKDCGKQNQQTDVT